MINRITTSMTAQMTLGDLNQSLSRLQNTQEQMSSGKRINRPSDDPYGTSLALQLNGELAGLNNFSRNVTDGQAWTQTATSTLANIDSMVQRVRELAVQSANGINSQANMAASAAEVNQLIDSIKQEANAKYGGQYIFSGTATTTPAYQSGTNDTYGGNSGAVNRLIAPGTTVQVNANLGGVLGNGQASDPTGGNLLYTLRQIASDMQAGNTSSLTSTDLQSLDAGFNSLTQVEAGLGGVSNRLTLAESRIQDLQTSYTKALSGDQDVDFAKASIDFSTQQAAYTAALRASAMIVQDSLMNFLGTSG
jgi:flagellar hook-associated protein 3 FlgL